MYAVSLTDIQEAAERIRPWAHVTPVFTCSTLDALTRARLFFKCENLQKTGAFKFRGACNAVMRLPNEVASKGVVTHSSGNHAQALAMAARLRGIAAHVVMPKSASLVKRRAVEGYGARIVLCEPTLESREKTAMAVVAETGATLIPPYDHPDIIAGQGTVAMELLRQVSDLDAIVAPIGGGGLISGISIAAHSLRPGIRVIGAEPVGADDAARSKALGQLVPQTCPKTIADGLLTSLGRHTWPVIQDLVERIITVTDEQIIAAMRLVWERMKLVIEPSSAVAVAAVLSQDFRQLQGVERVAIIISGGNVDLDHLPWLKT